MRLQNTDYSYFTNTCSVSTDFRMTPWTHNDILLYSSLFDISNSFVGQRLSEIVFYLYSSDKDFTEQPNEYGKSLLNSFDLKVNDQYYSIGNRFIEPGCGLTILQGRTRELEFVEEDKMPIVFPTDLSGQLIKGVDIYWMKIPFEGAIGYYPQEIEITTENGFLLISSIEVNQGEVNTEFTNEILLIDGENVARLLKLGRFGLLDNGREYFKTFDELQQADNTNLC